MRTQTAARRSRAVRLGVPAAVLGTLSSAFTALPAVASPQDAPVERLQGTARITPAATAPESYTVRPGDTVAAIAHRFGLRTEDVLAWNGLGWRSVIHPGQSLVLTGTTAPPPAPSAPPAPSGGATHTVVAGDTVFGIAQRHGTTVEAILSANGLDRSSVIFPGQSLALSGPTTPAAAPAAPPTAPPASSGKTHAVTAGDTLFAIAQRYGTSTASLYALNGLGPDSIIYPGQSLVVAAAPAPSAAPATAPAPPLTATLDGEQSANASLIIRIGRELGASERAIATALATAMVESSLRNLPVGDRDSLGLFQQRPSAGWGTPEQILDADRSTRVFFGGRADPNGTATRGLLDIPGWESMRFTDAAQAVQISAFPERYGQWEAQAYQWLVQHG